MMRQLAMGESIRGRALCRGVISVQKEEKEPAKKSTMYLRMNSNRI